VVGQVSPCSPGHRVRPRCGDVADLLLVVDNCEHLPAAAPFIGSLPVACPGLTVLATSREPLNVQAEQRHPVPALALPEPGTDLAAVAAVALFCERARAHDPDFELATDAGAVAEICRRLDGPRPGVLQSRSGRCVSTIRIDGSRAIQPVAKVHKQGRSATRGRVGEHGLLRHERQAADLCSNRAWRGPRLPSSLCRPASRGAIRSCPHPHRFADARHAAGTMGHTASARRIDTHRHSVAEGGRKQCGATGPRRREKGGTP
jgi:hypothetical protein